MMLGLLLRLLRCSERFLSGYLFAKEEKKKGHTFWPIPSQ